SGNTTKKRTPRRTTRDARSGASRQFSHQRTCKGASKGSHHGSHYRHWHPDNRPNESPYHCTPLRTLRTSKAPGESRRKRVLQHLGHQRQHRTRYHRPHSNPRLHEPVEEQRYSQHGPQTREPDGYQEEAGGQNEGQEEDFH